MKKENIFKTVGAGFLSALMLFSQTDAVNANNSGYIDSHTMYVSSDTFDDDEYDVISEDEYQLKIKQKKRASFVEKVRNTILLTGSFILSLLAKLLLGLITAVLGKGINASSDTLFGFTADCIVNFVIIAILFSVAYKIIFPKKSLKELFKMKNIFYMITASIIIEIMQNVLNTLFKEVYIANQIIQCIINLGIIGFVWIKTFDLQGVFGKTVKEALHSSYGKKTFIKMALGSIVAVFVKVMLRHIKIISGYAQLIFVFIIASLIIFCGCNLFRPRKKMLILK